MDPRISSPAEVVQAVLVEAGLGAMPGNDELLPLDEIVDDWTLDVDTPQIFAGSMPDGVNVGVLVYDIAGDVHGRCMDDGQTWEHHGLLINVRHVNASGYDLAHRIARYFDTDWKQTVAVNGYYCYIHCINRTSTIMSHGEEIETKRQLWSFNAEVAYRDIQREL